MRLIKKALILGTWDPGIELLENVLRRAFRNQGVVIEKIHTEAEFRERLNTIRDNPVDLALMHVRFPWTDAGENPIPPPTDVVEQGYFRRAGFRCERLLHEILPDIPIVIHSDLDESEFQQEITQLTANSYYAETSYDDEMTDKIREVVNS